MGLGWRRVGEKLFQPLYREGVKLTLCRIVLISVPTPLPDNYRTVPNGVSFITNPPL